MIVDRYVQRFGQIAGALGFGAVEITEIVENRARTAAERKLAEAAALRKKIPADARLVALDENGKTIGSADLARFLDEARNDSARNLCFVIGGPDGLDKQLAGEAALILSLGRITLPHGLARAVLAEQLYRAATILSGHPYHRA